MTQNRLSAYSARRRWRLGLTAHALLAIALLVSAIAVAGAVGDALDTVRASLQATS